MITSNKIQDTKSEDSSFFQGEFQLEGWNILVLKGPAKLLEQVEYISFTGDFGFRHPYILPASEVIADHIKKTGNLFSHFNANILNFEFIFPGIESDTKIDRKAEFEAFMKKHDDRAFSSGLDKKNYDSGRFKWYLYLESLMIEVIRQIPFGFLSLANNHALDYGPKGLEYNEQRLRKAGVTCFGTTQNKYIRLSQITGDVLVYSMTDLVDQKEGDHLVASFNETNICEAKGHIYKTDFNAAFVHIIANRSVYPSSYELKLVDELIAAGFKLIVCTGSHWIKGYELRSGVPVFFGTGNYLFSYTRGFTERQGIHVVAGLSHGKLLQLFVIPFANKFETGKTGPLTGADLREFKNEFKNRSNYSRLKFLCDKRNLYELKKRIFAGKFSYLNHLSVRRCLGDLLVFFFSFPYILKKLKFGLIILPFILLSWILLKLL